MDERRETGEELPRVLRVEEAGELFRISRSAAFRAVKNGTIPSIRVGRSLRVPTALLLKMLGEEGE
jgi:excisionase family DNA binding protein